MDAFSESLEQFYLTISNTSVNNLNDCNNNETLLFVIKNLEEQYLKVQTSSTEVKTEFVIASYEVLKDCYKKSANIIRLPYAEIIRILIANIRKKLTTKVILDNSEHTNPNKQKYLSVVTELLGTWSNVISDIKTHMNGASKEFIKTILLPLNIRVIESVSECIKSFKNEKDLETWVVRLMYLSSDNPSDNEGNIHDYNIQTIDSIITQVANMKTVIHKFYAFLYRCFHKYERSIQCQISGATDVLEESVSYVDDMLIVSKQEILQWRELEAIYCSLEFGFLNISIKEALKDLELLEIEDDVLIPQCIEDITYILLKIAQRSISTGSESCILAIGNKILELFSFRQSYNSFEDIVALLYDLVRNKQLFKRAVEKNSISSKIIRNIMYTNAVIAPSHHTLQGSKGNLEMKSFSTKSTIHTSMKSTPLSTQTQIVNDTNLTINPHPIDFSVYLTSTLSEVTSGSILGVNSWLSEQFSPYISSPPSSNNTTSIKTTSKENTTTIVSTKTTTNSSITTNTQNNFQTPYKTKPEVMNEKPSSMEELLLKALQSDASCEDEEESCVVEDMYYTAINFEKYSKTSLTDNVAILSENDYIVQINSISTIMLSIQKLISLFTRSVTDVLYIYENNRSIAKIKDTTNMKQTKSNQPIELIVQELSLCKVQYETLLSEEIHIYTMWTYTIHISNDINTFCLSKWNISGQDMEDRSSESRLASIVRKFFNNRFVVDESFNNNYYNRETKTFNASTKSNTTDYKASKLCQDAYVVFLTDLLRIISNQILEKLIYNSEFSEWGALLLHQEIIDLISFIEKLVDDMDFKSINTIKASTQKVTLAIKLLNLDAPSDIRRYHIPKEIFDDSSVRKILSRRIEYSKEAIANIRINIS